MKHNHKKLEIEYRVNQCESVGELRQILKEARIDAAKLGWFKRLLIKLGIRK